MATNDTHPSVAVIGLGHMGSAVAERLLAQGLQITVWNRDRAKARRFTDAGAGLADCVESAAQCSKVMLVCLLDHATTLACVATDKVARSLQGKTLVQLSSMTASESRVLAAWADTHGINYLEGQIQDYPATVRAGDASIICAGPLATYEVARKTLEALAARPIHVSEKFGSASTLANAQLAFCFLAYAGVLHGVAMCQAAEVSTRTFLDTMLRDYLHSGPFLDDIEKIGTMAATRNFDEDVGATLNVWRGALVQILADSAQANLNTDPLAAVDALIERAISNGHGHHDIASLINVVAAQASKSKL